MRSLLERLREAERAYIRADARAVTAFEKYNKLLDQQRKEAYNKLLDRQRKEADGHRNMLKKKRRR